MMDICRLGSMHQSRLSFVRVFVRLMFENSWKITKDRWELDKNGYGVCSYQFKTKKETYHLVLFPQYISNEQRNDRVVAEKWDVTFALVSGEIDEAIISQLKTSVPLQEYGRNNNKVIVLSRANKSLRVFEHIIDSLSCGRQPDIQILDKVGYILRTTAVYGNGKFGIQDFSNLSNKEAFKLPFCAQMCALYILRQFSFDLVDFLAKQRNKKNATTLCKEYKKYLGIGNATGLGMSLFLINHPKIIDNWMYVKKTALSQIIKTKVTEKNKNYIIKLLKRASLYLKEINTIDDNQSVANLQASCEIIKIITYIKQTPITKFNWQTFINANQDYSFEAQEAVISCILELYPQIVDKFQNNMSVSEDTNSINNVSIANLKSLIEKKYQWATSIDFGKDENNYWFWYVSKNKQEPRLGIRGKDRGDKLELPLDIARQVSRLYKKIQKINQNSSLVDFLIKNPKFTTIARRTWTMGNCQMGEIKLNSLAKDFTPIHLLRCKLSILGATKFDPRSDRWVRVTFFQNAPIINAVNDDDWLFSLTPKQQ